MKPDRSKRTGRPALGSRRALDRAIDGLGRELGRSPPRGPRPGTAASEVGKLTAIAARLQMLPASTWDELAPLFTGDEPDLPSSSRRTRPSPRTLHTDVPRRSLDGRSTDQLARTGIRRSPSLGPIPWLAGPTPTTGAPLDRPWN